MFWGLYTIYRDFNLETPIFLSNMHPSLSQYNTEYTDYNEFYDYTEEVTATENPTDNVYTETKVNTHICMAQVDVNHCGNFFSPLSHCVVSDL